VRGAAAVLLGAVTTLVVAWPVTVGAMHMGWIKPVMESHGWHPFSVAGESISYRAHSARRMLIDQIELIQQNPRDSRIPMGEPTVLPGWVASPDSAPEDLRESVNYVDTLATGWPLRCAAGEVWFVWTRNSDGQLATTEDIERPPASGTTTAPVRRHLWRVATNATGPTELPLRVVWGGLIADVAVWSAAWGVVLFGAAWARQVRRRRRGLCAGCGYDLRGAAAGAACPECGARGVAV
jgi:hypothetical protein